jgi:hypothetical protein
MQGKQGKEKLQCLPEIISLLFHLSMQGKQMTALQVSIFLMKGRVFMSKQSERVTTFSPKLVTTEEHLDEQLDVLTAMGSGMPQAFNTIQEIGVDDVNLLEQLVMSR